MKYVFEGLLNAYPFKKQTTKLSNSLDEIPKLSRQNTIVADETLDKETLNIICEIYSPAY